MIAEKIEKIKETVKRREGSPSRAHHAAPAQDKPEYSFRLLFVVVEHGLAKGVVDVLAGKGIMYHLVCQGEGTADSAILQMLNLDQSDKDIIFSVIEAAKVEQVLEAIHDNSEGKGVAFTIKMSSIGGMKALQILKGDLSFLNNQQNEGKKD